MKNIVCLYHDDCVDGFVAKTLIELSFKNHNVISFPVKYNRSITEITNRIPNIFDIDEFIIVDFSLSFDDIKILTQYCKDITIIDHHVTALELYNSEYKIKQFNEENGCNLKIFIEQNTCASSIVYKIFSEAIAKNIAISKIEDFKSFDLQDRNIESFIAHIKDYDNWDLKYPNTFIINEVIRGIFESKLEDKNKFILTIEFIRNHNLYIQSHFNFPSGRPYSGLNDNLLSFISHSFNKIKERDFIVNHYCGKAVYRVFKNTKVPFINCPRDLVNYVGHKLSFHYPFVFMYWVDVFENKVKISLRSNKENGEDVSKIAKEFNGGGHKTAAGVEMSYENFRLLLKLHVR